MLCVHIRIISMGQFKLVHSIYHYYVEIKKISLNNNHLRPDLVPWLIFSGLNYPYLEKNFHGPKDVWAIEVLLYIVTYKYKE